MLACTFRWSCTCSWGVVLVVVIVFFVPLLFIPLNVPYFVPLLEAVVHFNPHCLSGQLLNNCTASLGWNMPPLFTHHAHNCASASSSTSRAKGEVATNPKIFDHDWDKDDGYDQYSSLISTHADTIRSVGSKKKKCRLFSLPAPYHPNDRPNADCFILFRVSWLCSFLCWLLRMFSLFKAFFLDLLHVWHSTVLSCTRVFPSERCVGAVWSVHLAVCSVQCAVCIWQCAVWSY